MNQTITNKEFPVQKSWVIGGLFFAAVFAIPVMIIYPFSRSPVAFLLWTIYFCVGIIYAILVVRNFSFSYEEKYIHVKQGVINLHERFLPYQRVQHVSISQSVLERILGLFNVVIENASEAGGAQKLQKKSRYHTIGFSGNQLIIPGLKKDHAEKLRDILLERIKKSAVFTKSGL